MGRRIAAGSALLLLAAAGYAFVVSNTHQGGPFIFESLPPDRRPASVFVDTESIPGVLDPRAITQQLMDQWNAIPQAQQVFGVAQPGSPYNGTNVGVTFGSFTNNFFEVAWDDTGDIFNHFGVGGGVLGITLKSVDTAGGRLLDFLIVINTRDGVLTGNGATPEELFRATLVHEFGHAAGLGHTAVGMSNTTSYGLRVATPDQIPSMFPFRLPGTPEAGASIEADDEAALIRSYPLDTSSLGSLSGTIRAPSGFAVNGVAVRAVGPDGTPVESHVGILPNEDRSFLGTFRIPNLAPGGYRVVVETINGRGSVDGDSIASSGASLGANPFVLAPDEFWQPGDTFDPNVDPRTVAAVVQVRAGRDTGSIDFVLNGAPIVRDQVRSGSLTGGDARIPADSANFRFADYFVFDGALGDNVVLTGTRSTGVLTPELILLGPDLALVRQAPPAGASTTLSYTLVASGRYTVILAASATTGSIGGTGTYTLRLAGSGTPIPPAPAPTPATVTLGPSHVAADRQFASPLCPVTMMQARVAAPSHEELWVDAVTLRPAGTGDDAADVTQVRLVLDRDGDGGAGPTDPVLATGTFAADDTPLVFTGLDLEIDAGARADLLLVYDVTVTSVQSAGGPLPWFLLAAIPLAALRPRRLSLLVLLVAIVPLSCGGSGGGGGAGPVCTFVPFDPDGAVVTFQSSIQPGDIVAFAVTGNPATPLNLPASPLASATLSVSN